jgi:hypothetical protein
MLHDTMSGAEFEYDERVSRREAAERLIDLAYALAGGGALEPRGGGAGVSGPVTDDALLQRASRSDGDRGEVDVVLGWPA